MPPLFPVYVLGGRPGACVSGRSLVVVSAIGLVVVQNSGGWWLFVSGSFEALAVARGLSFGISWRKLTRRDESAVGSYVCGWSRYPCW